jgi:hypothetical protein
MGRRQLVVPTFNLKLVEATELSDFGVFDISIFKFSNFQISNSGIVRCQTRRSFYPK